MAFDFNDVSDIIPSEPDFSSMQGEIKVRLAADAKRMSELYNKRVIHRSSSTIRSFTSESDTKIEDVFYVHDERMQLRFYTRNLPHGGARTWSMLMTFAHDDVYSVIKNWSLWMDGAALASHTFYVCEYHGSYMPGTECPYKINDETRTLDIDYKPIMRYMEVLTWINQEKHYQSGRPTQYFDASPELNFTPDHEKILEFLEFCKTYESNPLCPVSFCAIFTANIVTALFSEKLQLVDKVIREIREAFNRNDFNMISPSELANICLNYYNN